MSLKDFEVLQELGKGAYGSVFKVKRIEDGEIYALKKVVLNKLNPKEKENALNEIRILASISSPYVISYKDAFYDEKSFSLCIIMDYCDDGDLEAKINKNIKNKTFFLEVEIWDIITQVVYGLKALHEKKIMHRDLKCANIFLTKKQEVRIGDMNVSKVLKLGLLNTQTGTPYYASPEVWKDKPYDYKSDIWSLGCILYEMCASKPPFRGTTMEQVYARVIKGVYDQIPMHYSKDLRLIIASMLQVVPLNRPSVDQLILMINNKKAKSDTQPPNNGFFGLGLDASITNKNILLNTIKIPRNMNDINRVLPKSKYIRNVKR